MRILIVEDEKKIANFIQKGLKAEKYIVDVAYHGDEGLHLADANEYDLVILDIMLPGKDGIYICREMRKNGINTPILMLTARDSVSDKVQGLDSGADDYITKPFCFEEFLARIRALTRRNSHAKQMTLKIADLELDQLSHEVKRKGRKISLTSKEYALLEYFMLNVNRVVTRVMLTEHVWDRNFDSSSNSIEVYINYLRNKIDKDFDKPLLHTMYGTGYMLSETAP
ncbi:MAG: DNA-binding response regulator [Omnitrophica WOR_2 bacterium GWF2_38_59]|nr:MAG: DNA-binding response regulator [Omnitrophica WOR_2 bacterium GWF2_38_59]OGX48679.1 MAG: DNA-binding response regulator [Omnitrophica WOR_2 bacterium RIFOXYA2_FULL_38_17]OGX53498.1 MAG: DNA-binding response regulator [Omnitrophica WOR_2 bacterium RIFOXYA12_FULL_38_10]OGX59288.1 MAG: DNA-binding response regulator [Omnitrophica WOR_2 bacterium RIFOXYC2_FULL_38_12]